MTALGPTPPLVTWLPIDTLPRNKDGSTASVLLNVVDLSTPLGQDPSRTTVGCWHAGRRLKCWRTWHGYVRDDEHARVTHWSPLPTPYPHTLHQCLTQVLGAERALEIMEQHHYDLLKEEG